MRFYYATQVAVAPPTIVAWSNFPDAVPENYLRYLHNGFRKAWGFRGAPIRISLRRRGEGDDE